MKNKKKRLTMLIGIIIIIIAIPVVLYSFGPFAGPEYKGPVTDHFDGKMFHNYDTAESHGFMDLLKWQFDRKKGYWKNWVQSEYGPKPAEYAPNGDLRITFVNHSTVLIQLDSINILTDPVWSYRVSPVSFTGPVRHRNPGIRFEDLPKIDVVLLSHNHYDHCDIPTLKLLYKRFRPLFLVPLGDKALLEQNGIETNVFELDWWQEMTVKKLHRITFVPARHFSMRSLNDRNNTLWGGFVINTENGPVYFAGDTGFGIHFSMIRQKFGPMRFSMLPIGAYRPRWFMQDVHMSPDDAVRAHLVLGSKKSMGIHFGTFAQADDGMYEPTEDLKKAVEEHKVSPKDFFVPYHGRAYDFPSFEEFRISK